MATIEPLQDDDLPSDTEQQGDVKPLREQLESRCAVAKIPIEDTEGIEPQERVLRVGMPCGRERRWIYLWDFGNYERLLAIPFERYVFMQGLDAVCNYTTGTIEAAIRPLGGPSVRLIYSRIFRMPLEQLPEGDEFPQLALPSSELKASARSEAPPEITFPSHEYDAAPDLLRRERERRSRMSDKGTSWSKSI